jgi:hypothetical protein
VSRSSGRGRGALAARTRPGERCRRAAAPPAAPTRCGGSGKRPSSWATMRTCCSWTESASGWAKIERTMVATKDCALLGTRVKRLRMKCVRQRC